MHLLAASYKLLLKVKITSILVFFNRFLLANRIFEVQIRTFSPKKLLKLRGTKQYYFLSYSEFGCLP